MKILIHSLLSVIIFLTVPQIAAADDATGYLSFGVGHVAVLDDNVTDPEVYKLEYRFKPRTKWQLAPTIGVARSGNDASFVFAVAERDFQLSNHWILTPSFGVGIFEDGRDVRLGNELEFRSGLNLSYQFDNKVRLGLALFHLSNGGVSDQNPGTEPMFLSLSLPLF